MARRLDQFTRDQQVAMSAAGIPVPDGSGRMVRRGVIVSAGDVMRSQADQIRNRALEMQTGAFRQPMEMMNRELARVPELSGGGGMSMQQQPGFTAPATTSAQPRPMRTLAGGSMPEAQVDPGELQRSLAVLRDERTKIGPGVKDYSDSKLAEIMRNPGGAQTIIAEANQVVPMMRENRQREEGVNYVTGLDAQVKSLGAEMDKLTKEVGAAPVPTDAQKLTALANVLKNNPDLDEATQNAMAEADAAFMAEAPWKAANRDRLARLEQIRKEQATLSGRIQRFEDKGILPRQATDEASALFGQGGQPAVRPSAVGRDGVRRDPYGNVVNGQGIVDVAADSKDFANGKRQRTLDMIAAGDAAVARGVNPGGAANVSSGWVPRGTSGYQRKDGTYVTEGAAYVDAQGNTVIPQQSYANEAAVRPAMAEQQNRIASENVLAAGGGAALTASLTGGDFVSPEEAAANVKEIAQTRANEYVAKDAANTALLTGAASSGETKSPANVKEIAQTRGDYVTPEQAQADADVLAKESRRWAAAQEYQETYGAMSNEQWRQAEAALALDPGVDRDDLNQRIAARRSLLLEAAGIAEGQEQYQQYEALTGAPAPAPVNPNAWTGKRIETPFTRRIAEQKRAEEDAAAAEAAAIEQQRAAAEAAAAEEEARLQGLATYAPGKAPLRSVAQQVQDGPRLAEIQAQQRADAWNARMEEERTRQVDSQGMREKLQQERAQHVEALKSFPEGSPAYQNRLRLISNIDRLLAK